MSNQSLLNWIVSGVVLVIALGVAAALGFTMEEPTAPAAPTTVPTSEVFPAGGTVAQGQGGAVGIATLPSDAMSVGSGGGAGTFGGGPGAFGAEGGFGGPGGPAAFGAPGIPGGPPGGVPGPPAGVGPGGAPRAGGPLNPMAR